MFIKNSLITITAKSILFFVLMASSILTARVLGPVGKGTLSLILLAPGLLRVLGNLGIGQANIYILGKKKYDVSEVISNTIILSFLIGSILIIGFLGTFRFFNSFFRDINFTFIVIALFIIPLGLFISYSFNILLGLGNVKEFNLAKLFEPISKLCLYLVVLLLFKQGVKGAVFCSLSSYTIAVCAVIYFLSRKSKLSLFINPKLVKETLSFGIKGHLGGVCAFLNQRLDMFLVSYFVGVKAIGYYAIAVTMGELLWYIPNSISSLIFAKVASSESKNANNFTPIVCRNILFILSLGAIILLIFNKFVIRIAYGTAYYPSSEPLVILLPGIVIFSVFQVLGNDLLGRGKPLISSGAAFIALILNIILNVYFIPKWGISGAALASTISYSIASGIVLFKFLKITNNNIFNTLIIKTNDFKYYKEILFGGLTKIILSFKKLNTNNHDT